MQRMYGSALPTPAASGAGASGLGVKLSDAMALPQNKGKSAQQVTQDIQSHGHTVIQ
jgi:L-cysteine desulfidase